MLGSKIPPLLLRLLSPSPLVTLLCELLFISDELVGMEILTHLRFTMDLKTRCEWAQRWTRDIRTHARGLQLVITTLLESQTYTCTESSNGKLEKDYFLFHFFPGTNIFSCLWILAPPLTVSIPSWHLMCPFSLACFDSVWTWVKTFHLSLLQKPP